MKRITRIIRPIICMAVLLFAMTTAVMGCYQKEAGPIDIPGRTPSGTSAPQPSATPADEVIPSVDRQAELAEARAKNPDTVAWLYIPGAEVDDPVMQAEDNGYYLKLDENGEVEIPGCIRNGISREAAEAIFDDMVSFAQYAFNKSHAAAYAVVSYQTAYLKYYYPLWLCKALIHEDLFHILCCMIFDYVQQLYILHLYQNKYHILL